MAIKRILLAALLASAFSLNTPQEAHAVPKWVTGVCERFMTLDRPNPNATAAMVPNPIAPEAIQKKPGQKKINILSSGFGMGHNSTAAAIIKAIKIKEPDALVSVIEVEALQPAWRTRLEKWIFWTVVKKAPWFYDFMYARHMRKVAEGGLGKAMQNVDQKLLEQYIAEENPDVVISVHEGTAVGLAQMRRAGLLKDKKVGFVMTDYMVEFYPEVSKEMDMSFLPHTKLEKEWRDHGVLPDRVTTTGMPVNPEAFTPVNRASFLSERGLDPSVTTVTLASGGEGVGNYPLIVKSLADSLAGSGRRLQIVAICGKNKSHEKKLGKMVASLRERGVELKVLGFTKQPEMFGYIKASDLYITKSGGLSPSEGFAMNKPMILLDVYGGHERVNATFFEGLDVAVINRDQKIIGEQAKTLLKDELAQRRMLKVQKEVTDLQALGKVADFVSP